MVRRTYLLVSGFFRFIMRPRHAAAMTAGDSVSGPPPPGRQHLKAPLTPPTPIIGPCPSFPALRRGSDEPRAAMEARHEAGEDDGEEQGALFRMDGITRHGGGEGMAAGTDHFLTRPVDLESLNTPPEQTPPSEEEAPTCLDLLDKRFLKQLSKEIGADGSIEVLRVFLEEGPLRGARIQSAWEKGAIQTIRREAHALAGAARNVGLTCLGEEAYALQKAAERPLLDPAAVESVLALLHDSLPLALEWVEEHEALISLPD